MKRKRNILTQNVYKWKARLNIHGGKQTYGVNYTETFSPVVNWTTIRLLLTLMIAKNWFLRQVDFVLAFPQADIEYDMYMELPRGIEITTGGRKSHVLKLKKNLYGQKQAGRVWNRHLHKKLKQIGFQQSQYDDCLYYKGRTMFAVYVDDGIFISNDSDDINKCIHDLKRAGCDIEDQGSISDYLGVNVKKDSHGIKLHQPHLIEQISNDVGINHSAAGKEIPAPSTKTLTRDSEGEDFDNLFDYRLVVGKLNFLEKSMRPDIAYAVHQCARYCTEPKKSHGDAIVHLVKYLKNTKDVGLTLRTSEINDLEVYIDADYAGNWSRVEAHFDPDTARSRTGYIIKFLGAILSWDY